MADAAFLPALTAIELIVDMAKQDIEQSLNSLDLASLNDADATCGLRALIAEDLKDTKLVVAAEDALLAEIVRALVHGPQADKAIKRRLEVVLNGMGDLACLEEDIACLTSRIQAQSQSTDTEQLELDYLTKIVALLNQVASTHSANHVREKVAELEPLEGFNCPISTLVMEDPIIIMGSGQTCDRLSAERWFADGHTTCPVTGVQLSSTQRIPNYALRCAVEDWLKRQSTILSPATSPTTAGASFSAHPQGSDHSGNLPAAISTSASAPYQRQAACNTSSYETRLVLQSRGDARQLCALVRPGMSMSVQVEALAALRRVAVNGQHAAVAEAGAIAKLVRLLHDGMPTCKVRAADVLGILARSSTTLSREITMAEAIAPLVALLQTGTPTCQQYAALALSKLACTSENVQVMRSAGAIGPLVTLLHTSHAPVVKRAAMRAIAQLIRHDACAAVASVAAGAVVPLVALLCDENLDCQDLAAGVFDDLACQLEVADGWVAVVCAEAIPALVAMLSASTPTCQQRAAEALASMAHASTENRLAIGRAGAVRPLVALLGISSTPECKLAAARALCYLAYKNKRANAAIIAAEAVAPLQALWDAYAHAYGEPLCQVPAASAPRRLAQ
eukprot:jgi/Chlat1/8534/Chrsp82S07937